LKIKHSLGLPPKYWEEVVNIIKDEVNVKEVILEPGGQDEPEVILDTTITPKLKEEGEIRELVRRIQELRKENNLKPNQYVYLLVGTDKPGEDYINSIKGKFLKPTQVKDIKFQNMESGRKVELNNLNFIISLKTKM
jgi:isoleucyl-tRNA synthetase